MPALPSAATPDSKDWYHVVLLHAATGSRAIANVNLDGSGVDAVLEWTLVVHAPGEPSRLYGTSRSQIWRPGMVQARPLAILGSDVSYGFDGQQIALRIAPRDIELQLNLVARPTATPLLVSEGAPFGSGYFGWGIMPVLQAEGEIAACGRSEPIDSSWFCYHDHNFGRFRWGEDFGWEWLVAHAVGEGGEVLCAGDVELHDRCRLGQSPRGPTGQPHHPAERREDDLRALLLREPRHMEGDRLVGQHPRDEDALALEESHAMPSLRQCPMPRPPSTGMTAPVM
jgi:hypothetical protein